MNRRDLIAGAVGLAGSHAFPALSSTVKNSTYVTDATEIPVSDQVRPSPHAPLPIRSDELEAVFDSRDGLPYSYGYKGQRLWGEHEGAPIRAIVCQLEPRAYLTVSLQALGAKQEQDQVLFSFRAEVAGRPAADFTLRYAAQASSIVLTLESVEEHHGFQLIEISLPQMVTVLERDGPAWMAEGRAGGSFVRLEEAKAYRFPDSEFFGRISTELPVGIVGQSGIACVMDVTAFMDGTETEIKGSTGQRRATLGLVQIYRVHGGRCYYMNDGGPPVCGNAHTPNLLVGQQSRTLFDFFPCAGELQPWLAGAKILRSRVPASPTQFFSDRFLYIVAGKNKTEARPRTTFAQSKQMVYEVARLTDHAPQTVFISGWVYDGQDTGYPSEDKINSSLGTYEDLLDLMESAKQWNANITVNVNYDDAYKSSPIFDEAFIARRPDGALWKSRAWDGEVSYIVGMAKFMEGGWGNRRIAYTMDRYKLKNAILIDALSWYAVRNDWDPQHPASGYKNLVDGKYKVLEQFRERGIAVTSEQLRYPFVGKLAVSMDGPGVSACPFGGEAIPLVATVYRGAAIWGSTGGELNEPQQQLFWNTRSALWFQGDSDRMKMADFYYLVALPYSKLHNLEVESYESNGSARHIALDHRSRVTMNTSNGSYTAEVNGIEIARDNATFCPIDENRIAFYTRSARRLKYPLPDGWSETAVTARRLTQEGRLPYTMQFSDGMIIIDAEAMTPVIVYRSESAIRG